MTVIKNTPSFYLTLIFRWTNSIQRQPELYACPHFYLKKTFPSLSVLIPELLVVGFTATLVWARIVKNSPTGRAASWALRQARDVAVERVQGHIDFVIPNKGRETRCYAITQSLLCPSRPGMASTSAAGLMWASLKGLIHAFLLQPDKQEQYFLYNFLCLEDGTDISDALSCYVGRKETRQRVSSELIDVP